MSYQTPYNPQISSNRKHELITMLEKVGIDLTFCIRCKENNEHVYDFNDITEVNLRPPIKVSLTKTSERPTTVVQITCQKCGYRSEFDVKVLERNTG